MPAPKGNEFYKLAEGLNGRPKKYTLEEFYNKSLEYFKYIDDNPHEKKKVEIEGGKTKTYIEYIKRPYTLEGLCNFLEISIQTLYNLENDKEFMEVITHVRQIIYNSKLDGATAGLFNANIVIRDLQLKDTATVTHETIIKELQPNEIKQLKQSLNELYGSTEEIKTIDADFKELDNE